MSDFHTIAAAYISTWNEGSSDQRRALLQTHWSEEARYIDPLMAGSGHDEIDALIAGVHARFPGFVFVLVGSVDGYADKVRFSWGLGPVGDPTIILGSDVVLLDEGRIASVIGFIDHLPATA